MNNKSRKIKILTIDDDEICLKAIKQLLLDNYTCEVETFDSATTALNNVNLMELEWKPKHYDIILTDIKMPIISGDMLTKIIKKTVPHINSTPIIGITSGITTEQQQSLIQNGINDVLLKPITFKTLNEVLKKYL